MALKVAVKPVAQLEVAPLILIFKFYTDHPLWGL